MAVDSTQGTLFNTALAYEMNKVQQEYYNNVTKQGYVDTTGINQGYGNTGGMYKSVPNKVSRKPVLNSIMPTVPFEWPDQPQIVSPFVDWDKQVWVVNFYHYGMEVTTIKAVFTSKEEADKFVAAQPKYEDQYNMQGDWSIEAFIIDGEVVTDVEQRE